MKPCSTPCRCWTNTYALGHDGHCCFLVGDRATVPHHKAWKSDEDACEPPHAADDALDRTDAPPVRVGDVVRCGC